MDMHWLKGKFDQIGSQLVVEPPNRRGRRSSGFALDVIEKDNHETFSLREPSGWWRPDYKVLDVRPQAKHLLLSVNGNRFLCGQDERHLFVAAIPAVPHSQNVAQAVEALKPQIVLDAQETVSLKPHERMERRTRAYVRQGEWFFVPRPELDYDPDELVTNEPLSRGNGSKPHMVDQVVRYGGEKVFVSDVAPAGLTGEQLAEWCRQHPHRRIAWTERVRGATVFARGKVRHSDHETIELETWHEVAMNREHEAPAMRHVVFLD